MFIKATNKLDTKDKMESILKDFNQERYLSFKNKDHPSKILTIEKPKLSKQVWDDEAKIIKETFEGALLLGYKPFYPKGSPALPALKQSSYTSLAIYNTIYSIPSAVKDKHFPTKNHVDEVERIKELQK